MVRPATSFDIPRALTIYHSARQFMRRSGNTVQWVNGYPSEALLRSDVAAGRLFVMEDVGGVYAVFAFIIGDDPTYQVIDGAWLDDATPYGTLHRLGSDGTHTGVLAEAWPGRGRGVPICGRIPMRITTPCAAVWNAPASRTPAPSTSPTAPPAAPTSAYDPR